MQLSVRSGGWFSRDFALALRAYRDVGLEREIEAELASEPIAPDDALAVFARVGKRFELAEQFLDVARFCHAQSSVLGESIRTAPDQVTRLTPFLRVPYRKITCGVPIYYYIAGDVADPAALTPHDTTYLVVRDPDDPLKCHALEAQDLNFLEALLRTESLERMLHRSREINVWVRWLVDLADAGFVVWLLPRMASTMPHVRPLLVE